MRGSPFFDGVTQVDAEIGGEAAKLPVFYHDASAMTALFPARFGELRKLMPDPRFVPARLAPGLGALAISCLEYYDTDIGPYNELAVAVPLNVPAYRANVPGRALAEGLRRHQIHSYVLHLPVTTEIALRGGVDFYGFPKFLGRIEFEDAGGRRRCSLFEGKEPILRLTGERLHPEGRDEVQDFLHLWLDRQPQLAEFRQHRLDVGSTFRPGAAVLELERRHPIAQELDRLLVARRSLQYEYVPRLEAILYGPEHLTLPLLQRLLAAAERVTV